MKILEANAKMVRLDDDHTVSTVTVVAGDATYGEVTIACEMGYYGNSLCVYAGRINTEDPGEGPLDEYDTVHDAKISEYGEAFRYAVNLVKALEG